MRAFAAGLLLVLAMGLHAANTALPPRPAMPAFLYTVAQRYEPLAWMDGGERFGSGAAIFIKSGPAPRPLVPTLAASADPALSFDGKSVLFSGKRTAQEPWQIWEIPLEGGEPRRITKCPEGCVRPFYLPEERIVYAEKTGGRFVIRTTTSDGKILALTYAPESSLPTDVLQDGRVLLESTFPIDGKRIAELYTVYSDGSGVESYRCDHGKARYAGKQVNSGDIVFAAERGLSQFRSALAKEVDLVAPKGEYAGDIAETTSSEWLMPWRATRHESFQLMAWKPGQRTLRSVLQERGANVVQPVVIAERSIPKRHPSGLHDWSYANLLCLNAYTSKYNFAPASIQSVRLYTRDAQGATQFMGAAPVESDGSFYLQVPGDQPLQIELLDSAGKTLHREQGWFWLRRGEQRACVGCHAGPETAPENAVPMVLLKSTTPADMTHPVANTSAGGH